ncbi:MAG: hypothetical protein U1C12_00980 [Patescibacteria group bacterium]|nr:hypothetical protein [Patescibacteria group bacterium]
MLDKEKTPRALTSEVSNNIMIAHNQAALQAFDPEADIGRAKKAAKALMQVVEATKPLKMQGKTYLYFEHWQTIARFFNATVGIENTNKLVNGYEAKSVVYQNGIIIGGAEASCLKDETNWKSKPDFQLKSMAQTRAMAKALRSIFGYVAVLAGVEATPAEEMPVDINKIVPGNPIMNGEVVTTGNLIGLDYTTLKAQIDNSKTKEELNKVIETITLVKKTLPVVDVAKLRTDVAVKRQQLQLEE